MTFCPFIISSMYPLSAPSFFCCSTKFLLLLPAANFVAIIMINIMISVITVRGMLSTIMLTNVDTTVNTELII